MDSILVAGGRMFKRLSKSRRHSADDVALSLSSPTTLDEPPGTSTPRDNCQSISPAALLRVSRTKYTRRSCGDASAMQALLATSKQEQEQDAAEADYQMVTAVPAFIVEHEPEKQRGECIWIRCSKNSSQLEGKSRKLFVLGRIRCFVIYDRVDWMNFLLKKIG